MDGVLLDLRQQKQCTEDKIGRCMDSSNCEESNWNPSCQHAHSLERGNILRLPLNCTACGKSFSHSSSLRRHSRTHTGVRPFVCEICNKGFYYKNNLLDHSRTHTGEKPFKCSDCGQSFAQSSTLNRHTVTHSKDKTCQMCGEVFKLSLLEKHFASHTEKYKFRHSLLEGQRKKLSCQKCRMKFERVDDLQKPLWVHKDRGQALYNELATIKGLLNVVVQLRQGNLPSTVESFNTKICP